MVEEPKKDKMTDSRGGSQRNSEDSPIHIGLVEPRIPLREIWFLGALSFSIFGIWFIYKASFTDAAQRWLPYTEETAQLLVPKAPDGQEPLDLLEVTHTLSENQISIEGKVRNRTQQPIEDILATITIGFVGTLNVVEKDVAVEPSRIEPGAEALFRLEEPLSDKKPSGYTIKFKLANGAIVRHKDSRFLTTQ
jgi:hypothetical protein